MTGFEILTGDIRNPSKRASKRWLRGGGGPAGLGFGVMEGVRRAGPSPG